MLISFVVYHFIFNSRLIQGTATVLLTFGQLLKGYVCEQYCPKIPLLEYHVFMIEPTSSCAPSQQSHPQQGNPTWASHMLTQATSLVWRAHFIPHDKNMDYEKHPDSGIHRTVTKSKEHSETVQPCLPDLPTNFEYVGGI